MVDRVVKDVVERFLVLLFGLDHFGPEASAEDMVLPAMAIVERAGVLSVQVAHAGGEVREPSLDDQVVVVAEQAAGVQTPAVAAAGASQDLREDGSVDVVAEDRVVVIALRSDVVVRAGFDVAMRSSHRGDRTRVGCPRTATSAFCHRVGAAVSRARHETAPSTTRPKGAPRKGAAKRRLWSARGADAKGSSRVPGAACAGTAFPSASSPGSARRHRRAHPPRSAPR